MYGGPQRNQWISSKLHNPLIITSAIGTSRMQTGKFQGCVLAVDSRGLQRVPQVCATDPTAKSRVCTCHLEGMDILGNFDVDGKDRQRIDMI